MMLTVRLLKAYMAGTAGWPCKCETQVELAEWLRGFAAACRIARG